jgi:hypothetical protein
METAPKLEVNKDHAPIVEHVTAAHQLLKSLEEKIGEHPALAEAILRLENTLSLLTLQTKGML